MENSHSNRMLAGIFKEIYLMFNKSNYFTLHKNNELVTGW